MIDKETIRNNPELLKSSLSNRNAGTGLLDEIGRLDARWREMKGEADSLRAERNRLGQEISAAAKAKKDISKLKKKGEEIAASLEKVMKKEEELEAERRMALLRIPNIPHASVPVGKDSSQNPEVRKWGKPSRGSGDTEAHHELGARTGAIDFERGTKLGGHRFTVMSGWAARLERALASYMLALQASRGYKEFWVPYMVRSEILEGTGQLPKFADDLYQSNDGLWLIPTAEVPLTNLHREEVLEESALPLKYCAHTPCFRREAGAYGKDIKGLIRQHQFDKVELVKFSLPEDSYRELEGMVRDAEAALEGLGLPYRVVELCTGDLGFASAKTYDLEAWVPSQDTYREISSCSNCEAFQARRANIRVRRKDGMEFVHTLNGSGVAVGRALIALVENHQEAGGIRIPKPLQPHMGTDWIDTK
ncbi:MAG TPA: serine--tRNA ligase [Candidatus Bilamarchaeaceae archaeon]|nr:serine--tRNA ligase [Candidatus Bilamarchaeaceae archaeon]